MNELKKYSLSDLFHIKDYLKEKLSQYPDDEHLERYSLEQRNRWANETISLRTAEIETRLEIEYRIKILIENVKEIKNTDGWEEAYKILYKVINKEGFNSWYDAPSHFQIDIILEAMQEYSKHKNKI